KAAINERPTRRPTARNRGSFISPKTRTMLRTRSIQNTGNESYCRFSQRSLIRGRVEIPTVLASSRHNAPADQAPITFRAAPAAVMKRAAPISMRARLTRFTRQLLPFVNEVLHRLARMCALSGRDLELCLAPHTVLARQRYVPRA